MPSDTTGPEAGGWGPVVAAVPFEMNGTTLSFQVPWKDLREKQAAFSWSVISTETGAQTTYFTGTSVPLPPAAWTGLATLAGTGLLLALRRRHGLKQTARE